MAKFLHEYIRYADGSVKENGWWKIDGNRLVNRFGGNHEYEPHQSDEIVEAADFNDLTDKVDYSYLLSPDSPYGWIDLEGNFYGCNYTEHSTLAYCYFKSSERELEMKGYVKVYRGHRGISYYIEGYLTDAQAATLRERGFEVMKYDCEGYQNE